MQLAIVLTGMALAGCALLAPAALAIPSGPLGVPGMSEKKLRSAETMMLGPNHAAEHAQMRQEAREQPSITNRLAAEHANSEGASASTQDGLRAAGPPQSVGQWGGPFPIPIFGIAAVMLPTNKVMWWAYPFGGAGTDNTAQAWLWDTQTGQTKRVDPPINPITGKPANLWCSGQSMLADGRVLVTGGNLQYPSNPDPSLPPTGYKGLNQVYTFNPFNETWTRQPDMPHGRWYPSQVMQPDGRTVIMSGWDESGTDNQDADIELFTPSPNMNGVGTLQTIAQRGGAGQPPEGELYPRNFVMPSGRTLVAGPDPFDTWDYTVGPGSAFSWTDLPNFDLTATFPNGDSRLWSTSVIEPGGPSGSSRVTITGGRPYNSPDQPLRTSETFDDANPAAGWQPGPSLNIGRAHANTVLLPDGSKAEIGGGVGARDPAGQYAFNDDERQMELYDPASNTWRLGPAQAEGRAYHSTAVLLPDARVISAGDNFNGTLGGSDGTTSDTAEIYSPPYLFKGARPSIESAPPTVKWGDNFGIYSKQSISRAVLMAPGATTHGYDTNEREIPLQIIGKVNGLGVNVTAPPNANVAPPGYYMLFLLNDQGVPSVSTWVRIDPAAPDRPLLAPGAIFKAKGKRPTLKKKGKKLIVPISCEQPAGSTDKCTGTAVVTTSSGGRSASTSKKKKKKKKLTMAKGTFSIPAGRSRKIKLKLTKRGQATANKKGKAKATLTITNKPTSFSQGYDVKF